MAPSPDLDHVLRDIACVRAVAVEVLRDAHLAEDVVQDTLLAATRWRSSSAPTGSLKGWLRSTARHLALGIARTGRRRRLREEAQARPETVPSGADLLERVALQRRIAAAVEALHSPDREIVALRYWEGLAPREIARQLELSPNAVSTRLNRARARLAVALGDDDPRRDSSRTQRWALVAAAWRPSTAPPIAATLIPLGALAMKKLALVVVLIAAALVFHGALQRSAPLRDGGIAQPLANADAELLSPERVEGSPARAAQPRASALGALALAQPPSVDALSAAASLTACIEVSVVEAGAGAPARGVGLELFAWSSTCTWYDVQRAVTNAEGQAVFERVHPGECTVYIHRLTEGRTFGAESLELAAGETRSVHFVVVPGATIRGVVRDYAGRPVAEAEVWLGDGQSAPFDGAVVTATDAQGRYELRHTSALQGVAARAPGLAPSRAVAPVCMDGPEGDDERDVYEVDLVLPALGGALAGSVVDETGAPVPDAVVVIGNAQMGRTEVVEGQPTYDPPRLVLRTDGNGRFDTDVMGAGAVLVRARGPDTAQAETTVEVPSGGAATVRLVVGPAARVFGRVVTDQGAAVEGARVELVTDDDTLTRASTGTDADGVFDLPGLPTGAVTLEVTSDSLRSALRSSFDLSPREAREWLPTLVTPLELVGRVVDEAGVGLADWIVRRVGETTRPEDAMGQGQSNTDANGAFRLTGCLDGSYTVSARPPGLLFAAPVAEAKAVTPATGLTTLVVMARDVPRGALTGRCVAQDDAPLAAQVTLEVVEPRGVQGVVWRQVTADGDGRFALQHLPVGTYSLRATHDSRELAVPLERVTLDAAAPTVDLGTLHLAPR